METLRNNLIKAVDLHLGFSPQNILTPKALNFSVHTGNFTALVGTNGSGKTTLLNALLGEPVILKGGLYLCEEMKPTHKLSAVDISKWISYVPQEHFYPGHLTVKTLFEVVTSDFKRIEKTAEEMNVKELYPRVLHSLSSGQRQRVFLARALLQNARVLLMDEPTNHLDPEGKEMFWRLLADCKKNNNLDIFVSTHDLEYVKKYCSQVLALNQGEVVFTGTPEEFFKPENRKKVFKE